MLTNLSLEIETAVLQSWPAAEVVALDGWLLRCDQGVTGRANSVWPNGNDGRFPLTAKIEQAAAFYRRHNQPVRYQLGPAAQPAHLDDVLAELGYEYYSPTHVQTAVLTPSPLTPKHPVALDAMPAAEWLSCNQRVGGYDGFTLSVRTAIMTRIVAPKAFATVMMNGRVAGIGLGVCANGWLGIFNMHTDPACRRQGVATVILTALANWATEQAIHRAYLQVVTQNEGAIALYGRYGFTTAYTYHYRRLP